MERTCPLQEAATKDVVSDRTRNPSPLRKYDPINRQHRIQIYPCVVSSDTWHTVCGRSWDRQLRRYPRDDRHDPYAESTASTAERTEPSGASATGADPGKRTPGRSGFVEAAAERPGRYRRHPGQARSDASAISSRYERQRYAPACRGAFPKSDRLPRPGRHRSSVQLRSIRHLLIRSKAVDPQCDPAPQECDRPCKPICAARSQKKSRPVDAGRLSYWCPRPESNRHAFRRGIFFPLRLSPPARMRCSWAGARLHHRLAALGARRLLSTPSHGSRDRGLARRRLGRLRAQGVHRI